MAATWLSDSSCCEKGTAVLRILRPLQSDFKWKQDGCHLIIRLHVLLERECCSGNIKPTSKRFQMKTWRPSDRQTPCVLRKGRLGILGPLILSDFKLKEYIKEPPGYYTWNVIWNESYNGNSVPTAYFNCLNKNYQDGGQTTVNVMSVALMAFLPF